jgi:hypothetical protein
VATLDFGKLKSGAPGEAFEGLVRLMGERLGMLVQWSGRGSDGGRDLIFVETQSGPIKTRPVRWLVSCKDNSDSNRAVTEKDAGSVLDKVHQHKCDGFLLATTTTVSTGLRELLDKLDLSMTGSIQTKVWDRFEITRMLLSDQCADLLMQFFPDHQRQEAVATLDAAREVVEASLPRFVAGLVRERLVPCTERLTLLSGSNVWPHDTSQQVIIDELKGHVLNRWGTRRAAEKIQEFEFDAFMAFADSLSRNFPRKAMKFLKDVAQTSHDGGVVYNAVEMLRENDEFTLAEEVEIARQCDRETLFELYQQMAHDILSDSGTWDQRLPEQIERFANDVEMVDTEVDDLDFSGGDALCVTARVSMRIRGSSPDPNEPPVEGDFSYIVEAHFEGDGLEIDSIA